MSTNHYKYTDFIIKQINRLLAEKFENFKAMNFDELNVYETVNKTFDELYGKSKALYKRLAQHIYSLYNQKMEEDWIDFILASYDDVSKFVFDNEWDRRRGRLAETIISSPTKSEDIDVNMRSLGRVMKIYADEITDKSTLDAYEKMGIDKVVWETEDDNRVCDICRGRDGKIYPLAKVPSKPHPNCRCWLEIV